MLCNVSVVDVAYRFSGPATFVVEQADMADLQDTRIVAAGLKS